MNRAGRTLLTGFLATALTSLLVVEYSDARRLGGGGGRAMRGGPAASGAFNRSHTRPSRRQPGMTSRGTMNNRINKPASNSSRTIDRDRAKDMREEHRDIKEDRYEDRKDYREDRRDFYEDRRDWYEDRWAVGAYLSLSAWNRMSCSYTTVIIDGISYYECNGMRYERVYRGTEITYIIVN